MKKRVFSIFMIRKFSTIKTSNNLFVHRNFNQKHKFNNHIGLTDKCKPFIRWTTLTCCLLIIITIRWLKKIQDLSTIFNVDNSNELNIRWTMENNKNENLDNNEINVSNKCLIHFIWKKSNITKLFSATYHCSNNTYSLSRSVSLYENIWKYDLGRYY